MRLVLLMVLTVISATISGGMERIVKTSDGVELFIEIRGAGSPCLYIHGGPGAGSYWLQNLYGEILEQHFTMVYLDQRGVGRSSTPTDLNYSIDRMVMDFEEVRIALDVSQWTTVAHSFGGILQVEYAQKHPGAHKKLIMVNCTLNIKESFVNSWIPYACTLLNEKPPETYTNNTAILDTLINKISKLQTNGILWKMTFSDQKNEDKLNRTYEDIPNWNNSFASLAFQIPDYWKDYKTKTSEVMIPVLFFYGNNDRSIGPQHYIGINFPNMTLKSADCGHMPFLEAPDEIHEAIKLFIND